MTLELQFKIKNNPYYLKYLRENSIWYKKLNREPETFKIFEIATATSNVGKAPFFQYVP